MSILITILYFIGYIVSMTITSYTVIYIYRNREKYVTKLNLSLALSAVIFPGFIYSTLWVFSITIYFSDIVNIILWKFSLITIFIMLGIFTFIHAFLKEYKKVPIFPILFFSCIFGLLVGSLLSPDSIIIQIPNLYTGPQLVTDIRQINYIFHPITGSLTGFLQISIVFYLIYTSTMIHIKGRKKDVTRGFLINSMFFFVVILFYILYIVFQMNIFRDLHIFITLLNLIGGCIVLIKRPELFLVLTNKIYYINIYHKSGILLYSYKFEKAENEMESAIWGNILIGLNHILSEFIDTKDQIDILQTKNSDIVVDYNNDLGFAILVITNQKNEILQKMIESFMIEFVGRYKDELNEIQDLNRMINVSEFKDTKSIIENNFQIYLR